ncbi:hypothetical protein D3C71_2088470 [compost metagenome]
MKVVSPCGRVFRSSFCMKTSGKKKSFQIGTTFWMAAITMAGRTSGSMMAHMIRASLAPSMRAASSSSLGRVRMKPVMMKTVVGRPMAV